VCEALAFSIKNANRKCVCNNCTDRKFALKFLCVPPVIPRYTVAHGLPIHSFKMKWQYVCVVCVARGLKSCMSCSSAWYNGKITESTVTKRGLKISMAEKIIAL